MGRKPQPSSLADCRCMNPRQIPHFLLRGSAGIGQSALRLVYAFSDTFYDALY